jgi:hypothetical protein
LISGATTSQNGKVAPSTAPPRAAGMHTRMPTPASSQASNMRAGRCGARDAATGARRARTSIARGQSATGSSDEKGATSMLVLLIRSARWMLRTADLTD